MGLAFFARLETIVLWLAAEAIAVKTVEFNSAEYHTNLAPIV
jgi:hypothetical protein